MEDKKKSPVLKVLLVILGVIAVIGLCVLSSRFSWFGTDNGGSQPSSSVTESEGSVTTIPDDNSKTPDKTDTSTTEVSTPESSETPPISQSEEQTTPPPATEQTTTSATEQTTTSTTTTTNTTTTTTSTTTTTTTAPPVTDAPKPLWTETECSKEMYITVSCYSRKEAVPGSATVSLLNYGEKVKIVATTDTSYSKLADGSFVHNDYLSSSKPAETTTTTTKAPQTDTPVQLPSGFGEGLTYNPTDCLAIEKEVYDLINEIRVQNGVQKLKWDPTAYAAAKIRAKEIFSCFSHNRPDGTHCYSVYGQGEEPTHIFSALGENIGSSSYNSSPAQRIVNQWVNSDKHFKVLIKPEFENMAVALYEVDDKDWPYNWAAEFTTYK